MPDTTNDEYLKEFKAWVDSMDDYYACILGKFPCLMKNKLAQKNNKTVDDATQAEIMA